MLTKSFTIKYNRWGVGFKKLFSEENTISQINAINQADYDLDLSAKEIAHNQYKKDQVYFFTFFRNDIPEGYVDYNNSCFKVGFLDIYKREYLFYEFHQIGETKNLFLRKAQYWQYEGNTDKKLKTEIFQFTEQGDITIHKVDIPTRQSEVLTSQEPIDVSMLYEDFPEFGEYEGLIWKERVENLELEI